MDLGVTFDTGALIALSSPSASKRGDAGGRRLGTRAAWKGFAYRPTPSSNGGGRFAAAGSTDEQPS
jgi:hypothetical protein